MPDTTKRLSQYLVLTVSDYEARIDEIIPLPDPRQWEPQAILDALHKAGVTYGVLTEDVLTLVQRTNQSRQTQKGVVIARGRPPTNPEAPRVVRVFEPGAVVLPAEVLARSTLPEIGQDGTTVAGETVPHLAPPPVSWKVGSNVEISYDGTEIRSAAYGELEESGETWSVRDLVSISPDLMQARADLHPASASGTPIEPGHIISALQSKGLIHGIQSTRIKELLGQARAAGQALADQVVAEGTPPRGGQDARIEFSFQVMGEEPTTIARRRALGELAEEEVVRPLCKDGDVLAVKRTVAAPQDGMNLLGETISAGDAHDAGLLVGANVELSPDGLSYTARVPICGYPDVTGSVDFVLSVDPPVEVAPDGMSVTLLVHPPDVAGRMINRTAIERVLITQSIREGVDWVKVDELLSTALRTARPARGVIALGRPPEKGEDAQVNYKVETTRKVGAERSDGSIDFYERSSVVNIRAGEVIAEKLPATAGKPGFDVLGHLIPGEPGKDIVLSSLENVAVSPDGRIYTATISGGLVVSANRIGVFETFVLPGDVNFESGNIHAEDATVHIQGSVNDTFSVRSRKHVIVEGSVGDAVVVAGEDVRVGRGILGKERGRVQAGGSISALFAQNATLVAGRDVIIANAAVNCRIEAGGKVVVAEGKARLIGGSVRAAGGLEVRELGSEMGVRTNVVVGTGFEEIEKLNQATKRFRGELESIVKVLGEGRSLADFNALAPEKRGVIEKIFAYQELASRNVEFLVEKKRQLLARCKDRSQASVEVLGTLHPGIRINILERHYEVQATTHSCTIFYDPDQDEVVLAHKTR